MKVKVLSIVLVLLLAVASVASATVLDIPVLGTGDGFWHDEVGRSYDYFDSSSTSVSAHYQFWGHSSTVSYNTGYAQFSLGSAPSLADIVSASLYLNLTSAYLTVPTVSAGTINHVANSSSATGNASQRLGGSELVGTIMPGMAGWNSFDITSYLFNDLNNGYIWSAFSFDPTTSGAYNDRYAGFSFTSAESGSPAYLRITTSDGGAGGGEPIPEPATMLLLGSGLVGLAGFRRKKNLKK